jgi:hypothetical protein
MNRTGLIGLTGADVWRRAPLAAGRALRVALGLAAEPIAGEAVLKSML